MDMHLENDQLIGLDLLRVPARDVPVPALVSAMRLGIQEGSQ